MAEKNIRVIFYKELIENSYRTYNAFLEKNQDAGRAFRLIKSIEAEIPKID